MAKDINDSQSVTAFISELEPEFAKLVEAVRKLIVDTDPMVGEHIKWNAPSFFYLGPMKAFNAKEYKRDIVVMNLRKNNVLLIFPTGSTISDATGILEGTYADGRRMVTFQHRGDIQTKGTQLQQVIRQWLSQVETD